MKSFILHAVILGCVSLVVRAEDLRDPFWPVGYQPSGEVPVVVEEEAEDTLNFDNLTPKEQALIRSHMNVSGILEQGDSFMAFINGLVVKQDDIVPLSVGEKRYRFRIKKISQNTINLEPIRDTNINVKPKPIKGEVE